MKFPKLQAMNSDRYLERAFDADFHDAFERAARIRRNVYLNLFIAGFVCIIVAAWSGRFILSVLSLFLSTVSLVIMTKYDTQLHFLRILRLRTKKPDAERG